MKTVAKKILPMYFKEVLLGKKTFELRKDEDNLQVGDHLVLNEYDNGYTGRYTTAEIVYVLRDCPQFGLEPGYCIYGIKLYKG